MIRTASIILIFNKVPNHNYMLISGPDFLSGGMKGKEEGNRFSVV